MSTYDVIIFGAGSAGATTAIRAVQKGLKVLLVDKKVKSLIGKKTCGDAVANSHINLVQEKTGFPTPKGDEVKLIVKGLAIHPPNRKNPFRFQDDDSAGYILDRHLFGQRLLNYALDAGVELLSEYKFANFIVENEKIKGAVIRNTNTKETKEVFASVIVDATGANAAVRRKLPKSLQKWMEMDIDPVDMGYAYRKIIDLQEGSAIDDAEYIHLYFIQTIARGGYAWVFPRGPHSANVGLGGPKSVTSGLPEKYEDFVATFPEFTNPTILHAAGAHVPIRRPMNSFVTDNFAVVGDSAFQVNPLHGGGIGDNMEAGIILADTIAEAKEKDDFSEKALWQYNTRYNKKIGAGHASLDIFRLVAFNMPNRVVNNIISRGILSNEELIAAIAGKLEMSFLTILSKAIRSVDMLPSMLKIQKMTKKMNEIKDLYENQYPKTPDGIPTWLNEVEKLYKDLKEPYRKK
jgi:digeranylgeranylglycerophospholipid reductase